MDSNIVFQKLSLWAQAKLQATHGAAIISQTKAAGVLYT